MQGPSISSLIRNYMHAHQGRDPANMPGNQTARPCPLHRNAHVPFWPSACLSWPCHAIPPLYFLSLWPTFLWFCRALRAVPIFFLFCKQTHGHQSTTYTVVSNFIFLHYWRSMQKTVTAGLFFMSKKNKQHLSIVYIVTEPSYCSIYETNQSEWLSFCLQPAAVLFSGTEQLAESCNHMVLHAAGPSSHACIYLVLLLKASPFSSQNFSYNTCHIEFIKH